MWWQARGTGLPGPCEGRQALPCGTKCGRCVLCVQYWAFWDALGCWLCMLSSSFLLSGAFYPFSPLPTFWSPNCAPACTWTGHREDIPCTFPVPVLWNRVECFCLRVPRGLYVLVTSSSLVLQDSRGSPPLIMSNGWVGIVGVSRQPIISNAQSSP